MDELEQPEMKNLVARVRQYVGEIRQHLSRANLRCISTGGSCRLDYPLYVARMTARMSPRSPTSSATRNFFVSFYSGLQLSSIRSKMREDLRSLR